MADARRRLPAQRFPQGLRLPVARLRADLDSRLGKGFALGLPASGRPSRRSFMISRNRLLPRWSSRATGQVQFQCGHRVGKRDQLFKVFHFVTRSVHSPKVRRSGPVGQLSGQGAETSVLRVATFNAPAICAQPGVRKSVSVSPSMRFRDRPPGPRATLVDAFVQHLAEDLLAAREAAASDHASGFQASHRLARRAALYVGGQDGFDFEQVSGPAPAAASRDPCWLTPSVSVSSAGSNFSTALAAHRQVKHVQACQKAAAARLRLCSRCSGSTRPVRNSMSRVSLTWELSSSRMASPIDSEQFAASRPVTAPRARSRASRSGISSSSLKRSRNRSVPCCPGGPARHRTTGCGTGRSRPLSPVRLRRFPPGL